MMYSLITATLEHTEMPFQVSLHTILVAGE